MLDSLFEALFSYRPVVFQQGEFRFDVTTASLVATLIVAVVVGLAVLTYRRVRVNEGRLRDRIILTSLRVAALALRSVLPLPPDARRSRGRGSAERRRGAPGRLAEHADSRLGRKAERRLRQGAVRSA